MTRTKLLTSILSLLFGTTTVLPQGMYVTLGGGYGLGTGTQYIGQNVTSTATTGSVEGVYGSLGEGLKLGVSAGYMFTENFGAELGFSYWFGKSIDYGQKNVSSSQTVKFSSWGIVAVPSVVLSAGMETVNPYARFGLLLGIVRPQQEITQAQTSGTLNAVIEEQGGLAIGYAGALGISIPIGGAVDVFVETVLHSVTYSPGEYEITKYQVNGADLLSTLTRKTIEYKESISFTDQYSTVAVRRPFSSIGFAIGARVTL